MNSFFDRDRELESLGRSFESSGASLYVLYGRRRLGKTTILRRFAEGRPGVYHMADRSTETDAIRLLSQSMAHGLGVPDFARPAYATFADLLTAFDRARPEGRSYLILDEYQYLCEVQPALSSILQRHWDSTWQNSRLMVVLCGSVMSMMFKETLARSSPLYGRRTGQWLLRPMRFTEVSAFFAGRSPRERLRLWAISGGVPRYAELVASHRDFATALRACALAKDGPLYGEARLLLRDEVTTPNVYWSVLHAIASGANRISEIAGRVGLPANQLTRYLAALADMGLVQRHVAVTERAPEKSKRGLYQLEDVFLRLWFGCIAPFESLLEFGRVERTEELMRDRLARHLAWAFEEACRQHVEDRLDSLGAVRVGRHWSRSEEVDVVAVDEAGDVVLAGECKWSSRPVSVAVIEALRRKVEATWPERADRIRLAVFSAAGFSQALKTWASDRGAWLVGPGELVG
jgi:AAA+ ATPase superfamily predicted ATPase